MKLGWGTVKVPISEYIRNTYKELKHGNLIVVAKGERDIRNTYKELKQEIEAMDLPITSYILEIPIRNWNEILNLPSVEDGDNIRNTYKELKLCSF